MTRSARRLTCESRNTAAETRRYANTVALAVSAAGGRRSRRASPVPSARPNSGPRITLCGRRPTAPVTAPAAVATPTGPARVTRPAAQPSGAAIAALARMRCHSAGISPGRCRRRAIVSEAASTALPTTAATHRARLLAPAATVRPARPPTTLMKPTPEARFAAGRCSAGGIAGDRTRVRHDPGVEPSQHRSVCCGACRPQTLRLSQPVADSPIARPARKIVTGPLSLTTAMVVDGWS